MDKIIIIGAGGHAHSCIDIIEREKKFEIMGLVEKDILNQQKVQGYPIIGIDKDLPKLRFKVENAIIAFGQIKSCEVRLKYFLKLKELKFKTPVIKSPFSYISKRSKVSEGTIIMHGAQINANSSIGKNCIINSKSLIEHDTKVGDNSHIAPGAVLNGDVKIGDQTFIGSGAVIYHSVSIGHNSIIGAGVVIKNDIKPNSMVKN